MVFSSTLFLFVFLPFTLMIYFVLPGNTTRMRNIFLLFSSLFFYAWGEPKFIFVMLLIILLNFLLALWAERVNRNKSTCNRKHLIFCTVLINVMVLFIFKYLNFTIENINLFFGHGKEIIRQTHILLPIGISFMTFQAMSYVFDVLNGKGEVQRNPLNVGLYIALFPQLIAGPIVRYQTIAEEIKTRTTSLSDFSEGVYRFVFGLAKKVLIANSVGQIADSVFSTVGRDLTTPVAWVGAIAYTLQIYFDFSGYSDMAIGLGRMFGFHFLENFDYPYISKTVTEFWRRWHISLGTWFRDYVYIPLGGSHNGLGQTIKNLFVVWLLTGIWHGANWTFIVWGLLYFVCLCIEKVFGIPERLSNLKGTASFYKFIYQILTLVIVICGWVIFRSENMGYAAHYLHTMFYPTGNESLTSCFLLKQNWLVLLFGCFFSVPVISWFRKICMHTLSFSWDSISSLFRLGSFIVVGVLSVICVISSTYNPFIYFNF